MSPAAYLGVPLPTDARSIVDHPERPPPTPSWPLWRLADA